MTPDAAQRAVELARIYHQDPLLTITNDRWRQVAEYVAAAVAEAVQAAEAMADQALEAAIRLHAEQWKAEARREERERVLNAVEHLHEQRTSICLLEACCGPSIAAALRQAPAP